MPVWKTRVSSQCKTYIHELFNHQNQAGERLGGGGAGGGRAGPGAAPPPPPPPPPHAPPAPPPPPTPPPRISALKRKRVSAERSALRRLAGGRTLFECLPCLNV